MKMSRAARSRQAASAAEPVSPEVAPMIVTCSRRRASTASNSRPSSCNARSLKARVGPWNSSSSHSRSSSWTSGATAEAGALDLFVEPGILAAIAAEDAVDHHHEVLDVGLPAGRDAAVGDDRPGEILGQFAFDRPQYLPAPFLIGLHRLLLDQLVH